MTYQKQIYETMWHDTYHPYDMSPIDNFIKNKRYYKNVKD